MAAQGSDDRAAMLRRAIDLKKAAAGDGASSLPQRPEEEPARLGELQRSLWLAHQLDPGSPAYNMVGAYRVHGELDSQGLEQAFNRVVRRHRLLHSTFRLHREMVLQVVEDPPPQVIEVVRAPSGEVETTAIEQARRPFELETGPLARLLLIEEDGGDEHLLLLVLHHIVADERSLELLWDEIALARTGGLDEVPVAQYEDYVHWWEQQNEDRAEQLERWRRRLQPLPSDLALPFEQAFEESRPRGRLLSQTVDPDVHRGLGRIASETGTTPFAVLAFTFQLLLERYQQRDVAFGTPVSTRSHPATAEMIGYFLNPLVVDIPIDERLPCREGLAAFASELVELRSRPPVPIDMLAEQLAPVRRRDRHPLFQTMFVYQRRASERQLGAARLEPIQLDLGDSKFDLTLFVSEGDEELQVAAEYRADRYRSRWMKQLLRHYTALLAGLVDNLDQPIQKLPMLDHQELGVLDIWQGQASSESQQPLLPELIDEQARRHPEADAVVSGGEVWSYRRLSDGAHAIAVELAAAGVGVGGRVGIYLDRSVEMIAAILGCHRAGAAYVPLDPVYPEKRNRLVLEDAEVAAVLTTSGHEHTLAGGDSAVICVDRLEPKDSSALEPRSVEAEAPAYVCYTSGSTGLPKGVVVTHGNLRASTAARFQVYAQGPSRFLLLPSIAVDSSVAGIFWTLAVGGCLVIPDDETARDARQLADLVSQERVTSLLCVPSLYAQMLRYGARQLVGLELVIVAGESCSAQLAARHFESLPDTRLFNEYGPTEATVWAAAYEVGPQDTNGPVPIGRPIPGVRVLVLDGRGRELPAGIPGQAWISGPTVARGYWRHSELTNDRFVASSGSCPGVRSAIALAIGSPGLSTASCCSTAVSTSRSRFVVFASSRQRSSRSCWIATASKRRSSLPLPRPEHPMETAISSWSRSCARTSASTRRRAAGSWPSSFPTPWCRGASCSSMRCRSWRTARWIASAFESCRSRPRQPRRRLGRKARSSEVWSLCSKGLLGRSGLGACDNFFELGGHSLLVVEMADAIERDHGVSIQASEIFQSPTPRLLAERIESRQDRGSTGYSHLFPLQPGGHGSPFIMAVPHFFSEMLASRFRGERPVYGLRGVSLRADGNRGRWPTMSALGEELVEEILRRFPDESLYVGGYSFGASMAFETARQLEERGVTVKGLFLIAPMALDIADLGPLRVQVPGLRRPVSELGPAQIVRRLLRSYHPLTRSFYRRASWLLVIQPWRRLLSWVGGWRRSRGLPLSPRILHADVRAERFRLHRRYRPGTVEVPTVIFNAEHSETDAETDAAATWLRHFSGPLSVFPTPDPHLGERSMRAAEQLIAENLVTDSESLSGQR